MKDTCRSVFCCCCRICGCIILLIHYYSPAFASVPSFAHSGLRRENYDM